MANSELFRALVERAFSGNNDEAFESLFYDVLRYLCSRIRNFQDAEDIAQDTLEKLWRLWKEGGVPVQGNVQAWVYRVAYNAAIDYFRRLKKNQHDPLNVVDSEGDERELYLFVTRIEELPELYMERLEQRQLVLLALSQVSDANRPFLVLSVVHEIPQEEIAKHYNCSTRTVQRRIEDGRREFQSAYTRLDTVPDIMERSPGL